MQKSLYRVDFGAGTQEIEAFTFYHLAALVDLRKAHRVQVQRPNRTWADCCKSGITGRPDLRQSVYRLRNERTQEAQRFAERISRCKIDMTKGTYAKGTYAAVES